MSGLFTISVTEARGTVAIPANLDALACVMGCTTGGTSASGLSPFYLSATAARAGVGYGDASDALCQIIEQRQSSGGARKFPACCYDLPSSTDGSFGAFTKVGTGATVMSAHAGAKPYGTYEAKIKCILGGTIGTGPVSFQWSLDGGRTYSRTTSLGTAVTFAIPNSGVQVDFTAATIVAGDVHSVRTLAPAPGTSDVDTAFAALAVSTTDVAIVVLEFPCDAAMAAHVTTGLNAMLSAGKRCVAIVRTRIPDAETSETDAAWNADIVDDWSGFDDSRINVRATYGLLTDAATTRQYLRSDLAQWAADVVRVSISDMPNVPADQAEANFTLVNASGVTVGHDEGVRGASTGLSDETQGNRFSSVMRLPDTARRESVFATVPWVMFAADERIKNLPTRRVVNALERTAVSAGTSALGEKLYYTPADPNVPGSTAMLTEASRNALHGVIFGALSSNFQQHIQNPNAAAVDTGLVQVHPVVTVTGGNLLTVSVTIAPLVFGYLLNLDIILAVQQ